MNFPLNVVRRVRKASLRVVPRAVQKVVPKVVQRGKVLR